MANHFLVSIYEVIAGMKTHVSKARRHNFVSAICM